MSRKLKTAVVCVVTVMIIVVASMSRPTAQRGGTTQGNVTKAASPSQDDSTTSAFMRDLNFSTYMGGTGWEQIRDVFADDQGYVYVTGGTASADFPTTLGAYDRTYDATGTDIGSAGYMEVFVCRFAPDGGLLWSTFLGGPNYDRAYGIEVDGQGFVYVAGRAGPGFPVTGGAFQTAFMGSFDSVYGWQDSFVAKLSPDGSSLVWASYVDVWSGARDIAIDGNGDVYLPLGIPSAGSSLPPASFANAFQNAPQGGSDAGVVKIRSDGSQVLWATYFGGSGDDGGGAIRVDASGNVYMAGTTSSTDLPTTLGAFDRSLNGGTDVYAAKFSPDGSSLSFATYLGGSGDEWTDTHNLATDSQGNTIVAIPVTSANYPTTPGAFQTIYHGGYSDWAVTKLDSTGAMIASTFLGGSGAGYEDAEGVYADEAGNVFISGRTDSTDFPVTADAYQAANNGLFDAVLVMLSGDLSGLLYSTYMGGVGSDWGRTGFLGSDGDMYLAGETDGLDWPVRNAYQGASAGGTDDILSKFDLLLPPSSPTNLQASPADAQVTLTWDAPIPDGGSAITNYAIYRGTTSGGETLLVTVGNILSHVDPGLTNGITYYYTVAAINGVGQGPNSTEAIATPLALPTEPLNLQATSGNGQATLTWSTPLSDGGAPIINYTIYRGLASGGESYLTEIGNVLTYDDTGLVNGQTYYYQVSATNGVGEGPRPTEVGSTPGSRPSAPIGLTASPGNRQTILAFSPPADNGGFAITNYSIYRGDSSGGEALLVTIGNLLIYTDTGLTNGQMYYYKVSAMNLVGEGPQSNEAPATPATLPSVPRDLTAVASDSQVTLTWLAPISDGGSAITGYRIYRNTTSGSEMFLLAVGNVLIQLDTGLTNGQTYYYQVSAVDGVGESPRSDEANATPVAPSTIQTEPFPALAVVLAVILIVFAVLTLLLLIRRRKRKSQQDQDSTR